MARRRQLANLQKRLDATPVAVREAVQPALRKSGDELADRMRSLAPELTGALKQSIHVTYSGELTPAYSQPGGSKLAGPLETLVTVGDAETRYPHLVEYGTADATAQPFFWPSVRLLRKRTTNRIKRSVRKAVREGWST